MYTDDRKARARKRAETKYGFYSHLIVYLIVNLMLFLINLITSPGYIWSIWPLIGWGVAIVIHALFVFVFNQHDRIVDRLTEEELHREEAGRE